MKDDDNSHAYWKATLGLLTKILIIWFLVSFGAGILFADLLNNIKLGGYPLGFWFAQQGSIYIFIVLIFYYAKKMGDIDRHPGGGSAGRVQDLLDTNAVLQFGHLIDRHRNGVENVHAHADDFRAHSRYPRSAAASATL